MNLKNTTTLTTMALLGLTSAAPNVWAFNGHTSVRVNDGVDVNDRTAALDFFKTTNMWPDKGILNTSIGFSAARGVFDNINKWGIVNFAYGAGDKLAPKIRSKDLKKILSLYDHTIASGCGTPGVHNRDSCANLAVEYIFRASLPSQWPEGIDDNTAQRLLSSGQFTCTVNQMNKVNMKFVREHPLAMMQFIRSKANFEYVDKKIFSVLLKDPAAVADMNTKVFVALASNPATATLLDGKVFGQLPLAVVQDPEIARVVRFLPKNVFNNVGMPPDKLTVMRATPEQIGQWQAKNIDSVTCPLDIGRLNRKQAAAVSVKVWLKAFKAIALIRTDPALQSALSKWHFWKNIPVKVFKTIVNEEDVKDIIPAVAYKAMTKEQRQLLLDAGDKDKPTTCASLPVTILKGKQKRVEGLKGSKKCFDARKDDGGWMMQALLLGLFDPALGRKLEAAAVKDFKVELKRLPKTDADGKVVKREPLHLEGVLALEALQYRPKGLELVKSFFNHKDKDVLAAVCKDVDVNELKKTKWLQSLMTKACVKHLPISDLDDAKKLHPNIWANMDKAKIKALCERDELKAMEGPFMQGLAANKHFAALSCKKKTKETSEGDEVARKPLLILVKASQRSLYFGADYVKNLPDEKECQANLAAHVASLADSALAKMDAAYIAAHPEVLGNARPEQFGRISDDLDASTYPASLLVGQVIALSDDKVKNLSAQFVGHMSVSGLAGFTDAQVKLLSPESLTLLCGEKAAAIKHGLSDLQKEKLGSECPATEVAMAPTNAHVSAFAAAAAMAAGSVALLL